MRWQSFSVLILLFGACAAAQTTPGELQKEIRDKKLVLRNFSAEPVIRYSWTGDSLAESASSVRTPAVFMPNEVKLKNDLLTIRGTRATIEREPDDKLKLSMQSEVSLKIQLTGTPPQLVISQLQGLLFFSDINTAIGSLPPHIAERLQAKSRAKPDCKCIRIRTGDTWTEVPDADPRLKLPEVLKKVDPEFTGEARLAKMSGKTKFYFLLDEHGAVSDLWLLHAAGFGLDERAQAALRKYSFAPALYDGKPVASRIMLEVNFQVF